MRHPRPRATETLQLWLHGRGSGSSGTEKGTWEEQVSQKEKLFRGSGHLPCGG